MAYHPFPYMQAQPPPGYGALGSTGYFTTQHLGGFYAPISNNQTYAQPQQMIGGGAGSSGQMFNRWAGVPKEPEKEHDNRERRDNSGRSGGEREHERENECERDREQGGHRKAKKPHKKKTRRPSTPWEQVVESLNRGRADNEDTNNNDNEVDDEIYDHCDCSASEDSPCSGSNSSGSHSGSAREDGDYDNEDRVCEVTIQPGGSAHVVIHLDIKDRPPATTCFVVSARRMRTLARGWVHLCHRSTDTYDTTVGDEAAVLGMYWMLQVLHTGSHGDDGGSEYDYYHGSDDNSNGGQHRLRPGMAPASAPRATTAIPVELPARVLAYATLFAHQFGVLDTEQEHHNKTGSPPSIMLQQTAGNNGNNEGGTVSPSFSPAPTFAYGISQPPSLQDRFRPRAEVWLRSITNNPRNRCTLDSAAVKPVDWPFVLYTARVLGDRQLFATCLRTLLERWWVNERGVFCDAGGPTRLDLLPESMRETVLRDLTSFKTARDRSVEAIINGAMNAFNY